MTVYRLGFSGPESSRVWIEAQHKVEAVAILCADFINSNGEPLDAHDETLLSHDYIMEETDSNFIQFIRSRRGLWSSRVLYWQGPLNLFKVGAYRDGCWIVAANDIEAEDLYETIAGTSIPGDIYGHHEFQAGGWVEEWIPHVGDGYLESTVSMWNPEGQLASKLGSEWIQDCVKDSRPSPVLLGFVSAHDNQ